MIPASSASPYRRKKVYPMKKSTRSFAALPMALVLLCPPVCIAQAQGTFAAPGPQPEQGLLLCALALGLAGLAAAIALLVLLLRRHRQRLEGNLTKPRRVLPICMAVFGVLSLAAGGIIAVNVLPRAQAYEGAINALAHRELDLCEQQLAQLPEDYADTPQMRSYVAALRLQQGEDFQQAATLFDSLGAYRDAKDQAIQCRVDRAWQLLNGEKFDEAKSVFIALQEEGAPGVEDCDKEADLRKAQSLQKAFKESGNVETGVQALELFKALKQAGYAPADNALYEFRDLAYYLGLDVLDGEYPKWDWEDAYAFFQLSDNLYDSHQYLHMLDLLADPNLTDREKCDILVSDYWSNHRMQELLFESDWFYYYLDGEWKNEDGAYFYFENLDGDDCILEQNIVDTQRFDELILTGYRCYGDKKLLFMVIRSMINPNEMTILDYTTGEQTTLTRQR